MKMFCENPECFLGRVRLDDSRRGLDVEINGIRRRLIRYQYVLGIDEVWLCSGCSGMLRFESQKRKETQGVNKRG